MAKKRKGVPADPAFQMFQSGAPDWEDRDEGVETKTQGNGNASGGDATAVAMHALQEQIAMLRENQQRSARGVTSLLSQTGGTAEPTIATFNTDGLPDPVTDPQGYAREIANRGASVIASQRAHDAWVQENTVRQSKALDTIWHDFSEKYPEYASHEKLVQAAVGNLVSSAQTRRLDVNKMIFGDTENFFADVKKEMEDMAGGANIFTTGDEDEGDENDGGASNAAGASGDALEAGDEDLGRTAGVFGGQDSGGRPNPSAKKDVDMDMFAEIRKFQQKEGWHL